MWVIAKYKLNELFILKKNLSKKIGDELNFYLPRVKIQKLSKNKIINLKKNVLEDYIFIYHDSFKNINQVKNLKNIKGLKYFLENYKQTQKEIKNFIFRCKENENDGFLNQNFFDKVIKDKAVFISGPLMGMMFKIIAKQGQKTKALIGNYETTIDKHSGHLYKSA